MMKTLSESGISNDDAFLASWIKKQNTEVRGFDAWNKREGVIINKSGFY